MIQDLSQTDLRDNSDVMGGVDEANFSVVDMKMLGEQRVGHT